MTFAEKMEERGIQKGMQKGIQKGKLEGILEGEARGKQEGKTEGKKDIALKMLNEGIELAFISKVTDLSLADLKRLQEKI